MFSPLFNAVTMTIAAMFLAFCVLDALHRARSLEVQPHWRLRGALAFLGYFAVAGYAPLVWDAWLADALLDLSAWPLWGQFILGLLAIELGIYAWHRTMHETDFLWRHLHQTHHSAERVDIWGAFWFHPLDMAGWALLGSLVLVGGLGIAPQAAIAVALTTAFLSMFTHANIRTSHWLGWFISRPEMHALHHERGVHRWNYSDLPLWDIVFGTWRNPRHWDGQAGFHDRGSLKLWSLLIGRKLA